MNFDEFTGEVQHRLELPGTGETVRAIRATLVTLGQRIPDGAAEDLAASLPMEIRWYMTGAVDEHGQRFDWREFVSRVSEIEGNDPSEAAYHARVIVDLVRTQVPESDFSNSAISSPKTNGTRTGRNYSKSLTLGAGVTPKRHRQVVVRNLRTGDRLTQPVRQIPYTPSLSFPNDSRQ